ncbi:MAG: MATE family efflux transporter [Lysobacteraceae bacterium]|nr:MAG: MATE family efflux transporter [Xanthomonadaceae bacterium]
MPAFNAIACSLNTPTQSPSSFFQEARTTLVLAAPLIVGQLTNVAMNFVDTVMAGRLSTEALAAVAIGSSLWSMVILFMIGTLLALPSFVSQYDGAGKRQRIGLWMRQAYWVAAILAVGCFIFARSMLPLMQWMDVQAELVPVTDGYLHAISWGAPGLAGFLALRFLSDGLSLTRPTMYVGLVGLALNIPANYVLMYGKLGFEPMGAIGCGYATAFVVWSQFVTMALWIAIRPAYKGLNLLGMARPHWGRIMDILRVGVPVGISFCIESSLFVIGTLLVGTMGTAEVAGHQVALNFAALWFMVPLGISMALTVRVGNSAGRRDRLEVGIRSRHGISMIALLQIFSAIMMLTIPHWIAGIYTTSSEVLTIAIPLIMIAGIFQISDGIQVAAFSALRGIKDTQWPMVLTVAAYWGVGIPASWLFGIHWDHGAPGVWWGLIAGLTVAAVLLLLRLRYQQKTGQWLGLVKA